LQIHSDNCLQKIYIQDLSLIKLLQNQPTRVQFFTAHSVHCKFTKRSTQQPSTIHVASHTDRQRDSKVWRPLLPYGYSYKASCARPC